jgi:hypothetical protein
MKQYKHSTNRTQHSKYNYTYYQNLNEGICIIHISECGATQACVL